MPSSKKLVVALVVGTRPEIIKMMPVHKALAAAGAFAPLLISTGQQREMSRQAFAAFDTEPDVDLDLMTAGQALPELTAKLINGIAGVLQEHSPDVVLVHGDTTTALAGALAAFYQKIPIGHVEAGLRTHDLGAPWPEEMNRRLVDPLCRWCFAPTSLGRSNLLAENIPEARISVTGNTVIDALLGILKRGRDRGLSAARVAERSGIPGAFVSGFLEEGASSPFVLVTGHRRESFGDGFDSICRGIRELVTRNPRVGVIYPVHLNPNVQEPVMRLLGGHPRIALIEPVSYEDFIVLLAAARFVLTDSGGIQEEAPSLGKPVLVMRDTTERPEGIEAGTCRLVGTAPDAILAESEMLLNDPEEYSRRSHLRNPYGDGHAAEHIASVLHRQT